ncbi:RNA-binding domain protein, putative [Perkinsus marinus ATCC 50983]|uniref:RNA-binding domain protein, putative n=1 Tax=Perkinsus marinus (strain ATCC 50983 / TXsc) TaxID=423536 RepID=C5KH14_PERM5|nr:RNA-binding domain protein, putative [Perkinsus marinus ATCC 50983]EER15876.1 RNA-binding domain protein, putative [Perkinsus marinus ATCC 50983]|eukprot:XP_002784080.1 RNA-binding domain protein, putative [Perkinsus marinus ATCC 50983]
MSTEEGQSSRVIVKNLPKHVDNARLKEFFAAHGEVTDARVIKTKDGRSRCFGFVGFRSPAEAKKALRAVDNTFMDTSRLQVAMALAAHSTRLPRAWSKYSKATQQSQEDLAASGVHGTGKSREERQAEETKRRDAVIAGKAEKVEHVGVRRGKAGVASVRTHVAFKDDDDSSDEEEEDTPVEDEQQDIQTLDVDATEDHPTAAESGFGGGASDMDFLRSKMVTSEGEEKDSEAKEANDEDNEEDEEGSEAAGDDSDAVLMDTARLLLVNLPYIATEDDIKKAFQKFGSIEDVVVLRDEDSKKSRGMAYVTYLFPEHAVRAKAEMHGKVFQGRVLRIKAAQARPKKHVERDEKRLSRKQEQLKKRRENAEQHTWNLLFVSANSAVTAAASKLGLNKADVMDVEADDLAVRAAVGETEVVREVKQWLKEERVRVDAFERKGTSLLTSKATTYDAESPKPKGTNKGEKPQLSRSKDTLILKHLPAESVTLAELRAVIGKYVSAAKDSEHSALQKLLLAPTRTVAIAQFVDQKTAQHAFKKLSYRRFKNAPLYVEWAPENIFEPKSEQKGVGEETRDEREEAEEEVSTPMEGVEHETVEVQEQPRSASKEEEEEAVQEEEEEEEDGAGSVSVFVKGLSFDTTEETLREHFKKQAGYIKCSISRKTMPDGRQLSMGFGFVEFKNHKAAKECIKRLQGSSLDGRTLELQIGRGGKAGGGSQSKIGQAGVTKADTKGATNRLCVRNVAFEASRRDIRKLFSTYGNVVAVRMPLKVDRSGHRGFAFVEFVSRSEALAAMEALQHTHLYGRRLVLEPAAHEDTSIETAKLKQDMKDERKRHEKMNESAKRRKINSLEE